MTINTTHDPWRLAFGGTALALILACEPTGRNLGPEDIGIGDSDTDGSGIVPLADAAFASEGSCGDEEGTETGTPGGGSSVYYLAVDGDDANAGTELAPFGSFAHAIGVAEPGDTIVVRGGTYMLDGPVVLDKSGSPGSPISLWAHDGEVPVLDFSANPRHASPPQPRDDDSIAATADALGIHVAGGSDWWHLRGLTVQNAPYYGVRVYGSHNVFEGLVMHDNQASGLELTGKEGFSPSDNLVLNCDSFHNFDPQTNGEDADGFAAKFDLLGPGNVFRGTRAWSNSDDGYDLWHAAPVLIEDSWAFDNGFNRPEWAPLLSGTWQGDGMGFKLGQDAGEHVLNRVAAWSNKGFGIDENGNSSVGGVTINHATLVNNTKSGNPIQISLNDGRPHVVRNTIAFDLDGPGVTEFAAAVDDAFNTWNGLGVSAADFVDLDAGTLFVDATGPRLAGGTLPAIGLHLAPGSALVDAGIDVGLPFSGAAPDLGAFEGAP